MKGKSLVDRLADVDASQGLFTALRTVLDGNSAIQVSVTNNNDLLAGLADAIVYEYIERPRWRNGDPIRRGDLYLDEGELREVANVYPRVKSDDGSDMNGKILVRCYDPITLDTQEHIDSDSAMSSREYVSDVLESSIENLVEQDMQQMMIDDLLRRQRELDRREA